MAIVPAHSSFTEQKKHSICLSAIEAKKDIEWKFLELGKMLYEIKQERMYEAGWESWDEYCMELKLSASTISKLFRIYEVFVLHYKIEPMQLAAAGGWSSVAELLPLVDTETTSEKRVQELLGIATSQTRKHFRATISEEKRGSPCKHLKKHRLVLEICEGCPERWRINDGE